MTTSATKDRTGQHGSDTNAPASPSKRRPATTGGGATLGRTPTVAMPLHRLPQVSTPDDPLEVEAEQVAQRVVAGQPGGPISSTGPPAANQRTDNDDTVFAWLQRLAVGQEQEETQRVAVGEDDEDVQRLAVGEDEQEVQRVTVGEHEDDEVQRVAVGEDEEARESVHALVQRLANGSPNASPSLGATLDSPGPGAPIPSAVRTAIEPGLGVRLGGVEVHTGPRAERAADTIQARAFTNGNHIFLNRSESPHDVGLMAHEATHVVQQQGSPAARTTLMRDLSDYLPDISLTDVIPQAALDAARDIPGYDLLSTIAGEDLLTGEPASTSREEFVEDLLTYGPFGAAVGSVMKTINVLEDVFTVVTEALAAHDLTLARIGRDIEQAWDDFSLSKGIDGNVAVVRGLVNELLADVSAFIDSIVDRVIELVRSVAVDVAEPLLETEPIGPLWDLTKKVLHYDPLRGEEVQADTVDILADFLRLIGKEQRLEQMQERGTLQRTADWLDTQLDTFESLIAELGALFSDAWNAIQPENLPDLLTNLESLAQRTLGLIRSVGQFAWTLIEQVLAFIKESLLGWLSDFAHEVPGFHLLTVIIQRNPFTGERVPRTAENLIRGFITLLPGGNAVYDELAQTGVVGEAAARIEGAMSELGISWGMVVGLFRGIWDSLTLEDLIDPIGAFTRIRDQFGEPISRLFAFIRIVVEEIFKLVLAAMNFPSDAIGSIAANAMQAYEHIKRNLSGFFINMLAAVKAGFSRFFDNILDHLLGGLIDWLFRGLREAGIEPPSELTLETGLDLVLQVLDLTADRLWEKLAERIGQDRVDQIRGAIDRLEGIWTFVTDVQERGIVAVWEYIQGQLTNLWDTIIEQARNWIMERIINRVTAKLLSMLDPTGVMAVVNSFIAFFNAIQSAVEYMRDILDIVDQYVATLAAVARGDIEPGAARLEQGLASAIPVAIGFLANQVGLGNIGEKITEIVGGLRGLVDQALDWLLDQAERMLDALLRTLGFGREDAVTTAEEDETEAHAVREPFELEGQPHEIYADSSGRLLVASGSSQPIEDLDQLRTLHSQYKALPDDATKAQREQIIEDMIALIKDDPTLIALLAKEGIGDPPNLGNVRRHRAQDPRFRPPGGEPQYAALWEMESEHVLSSKVVSETFQTIGWGPIESGKSEYRYMHTILIYLGAAAIKTRGEGADLALIREHSAELEGVGQDLGILSTIESERGRYSQEHASQGRAETILRELIGDMMDWGSGAVDRTKRAIQEEHDENALARGKSLDDSKVPEDDKVDEAFQKQLEDIAKIARDRL